MFRLDSDPGCKLQSKSEPQKRAKWRPTPKAESQCPDNRRERSGLVLGYSNQGNRRPRLSKGWPEVTFSLAKLHGRVPMVHFAGCIVRVYILPQIASKRAGPRGCPRGELGPGVTEWQNSNRERVPSSRQTLLVWFGYKDE